MKRTNNETMQSSTESNNGTDVNATLCVNDEQTKQSILVYKALEKLLGEIETSFFSNTSSLIESNGQVKKRTEMLKQARQHAQNESFFDELVGKTSSSNSRNAKGNEGKQQEKVNNGETNSSSAANGVDGTKKMENTTMTSTTTTTTTTTTGSANNGSDESKREDYARSNYSQAMLLPVMRPIPCVICIIEPEITPFRKPNPTAVLLP